MRFSGVASIALLAFSLSAAAAEMGGNCTTGLSMGHMMQTDCSVKTEYQGKTYCFSSEQSKQTFMADPEAVLGKARAFYAKNAEPEREKLTQDQALQQIKSASCDLSNKDLGYLEFDGMDLHHCKMVNTSFFGAYLRGANLSGADLRHAYLNLARLEGTNLSGANLSDATVFQAIFDKTNFAGANLTHARVIGTLGAVDMSGVQAKQARFGLDIGNQPMGQMKFDSVGGKFKQADFEGADLNIAGLSFADLSGANLKKANLHRADLVQADLTGADLSGADLTDAEVEGAIFKEVKGLDSVKGLASVKGHCSGCK